SENELMEEGNDQPVYPDDDHEVHLAIHQEKSSDDLVRAHMNEHVKLMRWQQQMAAQPVPPEMAGAEGGGEAPGGEGPAPADLANLLGGGQ
ncbi:MAG: hypothetical protein AAB922_00695, partial [Patescibacteria group bacterium]